MTTEAVRTGSRRLELGSTLASFMRELGLDPGRGGKRSDAYRLREQMQRLFRSTISFEQTQQDGSKAGKKWLDMQIAPQGELWWDPVSPEQPALWGSWVELGEAFHEAIIASPVPVDLRALQALKNSPLALDLYAWATYKTYSVNRSGKAGPERALAVAPEAARLRLLQPPPLQGGGQESDPQGPGRLPRLPGG